MAIDLPRRKFLQLALSLGAYAAWPVSAGSPSSTPFQLVGCARRDAHYGVAVVDDQWQLRHWLPLPERGHDVAIHPSLPIVVAISRRPGQYLHLFDVQTGRQLSSQQPEPERFFYGHAVFSADGRFLYTTEGFEATCNAVIGCYEVDAQQGRLTRINEWPLQNAIGPHELTWWNDHTLMIAIGGIKTRGREKLNLDQMQPYLVYFDIETQTETERVALPQQRASIRHLAVTSAGRTVVGLQYQGDPDETDSLVAIHERGQPILKIQAENPHWSRFSGYIGSVATMGEYAMVSSPRGGVIGLIDTTTPRLERVLAVNDVCPIVALPDEKRWIFGSGLGTVVDFVSVSSYETVDILIEWDNHWKAVTMTE
uniref:DUF1513 domain-containing protein n=1 Tax=Thaumasiovibrio occultus TaxID=1891184 RepID=UPI000B356705|nr:DUF1513 domain-containing protein [Thaumasiovibrio occultus]